MNSSMNIAVLAWGSLVNQSYSPIYQANLEIEGNFEVAAGLKLPIRMSRLSGADTDKRRYTLVIDKNATDEKVYIATSKFHNLEKAKDNLQKREGTIPKNISYLKLGSASEGHEEEYYLNGQIWSGKKGEQLSSEKANGIIKWAQRNNFQSVIWTGLQPNVNTNNGTSGRRGREILESLERDAVLLKNTQEYIKILPYRTSLQNHILDM